MTLTRREIDVAEKLANGKSDKIIADELGIKMGTLRSYIGQLFLKLQVSNRTRTAIVVAFLSRQK